MTIVEIKPANISDITKGGRHLRFSDGDVSPLEISKIDFDRCDWTNIRAKGARFEEAKITRCRFSRCYLPNSQFQRVDLTGTSFIDCDLRHAQFDDCKLWYVEFNNCELNYEQLINNAPVEVNLRRRLLNSLRRNAIERKESRMSNRLLLLEMAARRREERSIFLAATDYFRDHFTLEDRLKAFGRWLLHWVELIIWGYGVRLSALTLSALTLLVLAAFFSWSADAEYLVAVEGSSRTLPFFESLYAALVTFSALDDYLPANSVAKFLRGMLPFAGGVFLGLFAAAAYRRIER